MTATTTASVDLSIPARPCAAWCTAGPHEERHPEDRGCWSDFRVVPLTEHPPVQMSDRTWQYDSLDVCLRSEPRSESAHVIINHEGEGGGEFTMTLDEAEQLSTALAEVVRLARRD